MSYGKRVITETQEYEVLVIECDGCGAAEVRREECGSRHPSASDAAVRLSLPLHNSSDWVQVYVPPGTLAFCKTCGPRVLRAVQSERATLIAEKKK